MVVLSRSYSPSRASTCSLQHTTPPRKTGPTHTLCPASVVQLAAASRRSARARRCALPHQLEIKHGRICQLAFLGQITTRGGLYLPGNIDYSGDSFDSFPNGVAALIGPDSIPTAGFVQLVAFIGVLECTFMRDVEGTGNEFVGDFRNGYIDFGWDDFDEETKLSKRASELNNGRAAMMGILGLMVHEEIVPLGYDPDLPLIGHLS